MGVAEPAVRVAQPLAPWLQRQLKELLLRRGHALLLQGPSGLGQYPLGLALAQAWLCDQASEQGACGHCGSCALVQARSHPDLSVLMPETTMLDLAWPLDEKTMDELDAKKRKPSREIRVDAVRATVEFAQRTAGRGRGTVVLVYPAERMNNVAANALLKTLEEPAGDTRFVLATEAAHQLLPTIRSRCQSHALVWPEHSEALQWLGTQTFDAPSLADAASALALLRFAGGRPEDAVRLASGAGDAKRWALLPKAIAKGDATALAGLAPPAAVDALQKLCHDLWATHCGAEPRFFKPADLPAAPSAQSLSKWATALQASARVAEHPFKAELMLEDLASQARLCFKAALN